jgi:uncharacterized membrane-anchored protein
VRKARGSLFVVDATNQIVRGFLIYIFYNYTIQHSNTKTKKIPTYSSSYTEHVAALILYLVHVFYTLRHVLSEMIEIVPPYHTDK